jgi:hypothetical protein
MSKKFTLQQLTEGIRQRHLGSQNHRLVEKWARTGLLRGLEGTARENMSALLENQAAQLLRETNSISTGGGNLASSGDIRGFTNIAFPIVRRVFGGLVANELVSIQPMSLPSGLLFYLDYTYGTSVGGDSISPLTNANQTGFANTATYGPGQSIYSAPPGKGIRSGSLAVGGQYDLAGSGYSRVQDNLSSLTTTCFVAANVGAFNNGSGVAQSTLTAGSAAYVTGTDGKLLQFDPQITDLIEKGSNPGGKDNPGGSAFQFVFANLATASGTSEKTGGTRTLSVADLTLAKEFAVHHGASQPVQSNATDAFCMLSGSGAAGKIQGGNVLNVRRLNQIGTYTAAGGFTSDPLIAYNGTNASMLMVLSGGYSSGGLTSLELSFPLAASLNSPAGGADGQLTIPTFESNFASDPSPVIPEIDIKIESIAVTAVTRKLRARWSPELAQDLNAYHSLDAEVELTQILSEQIALELDREILNDLLTQANGANLYWSRAPGKFVNKESGKIISRGTSLEPGPAFTGTVREWYETLIETIIDAANQIHRKTLRGSANFIVVGPDVATILEASVLYRPDYSLDGDGQVGAPMTVGAEKVGTLSNRFTVYKDPYFPRNKILVGYKGGSYLETGYVYAPYVPLIVTPTIFAPEDFTPRKGVMTRYGKKMVRSDFYGTVTVMDLNII